jgi:hypothetical protein
VAPRRKTTASSVCGEPLDVEGVRRDVGSAVIDLTDQIVVVARAEAAVFMGEQAQAAGIIRRRVWPETD